MVYCHPGIIVLGVVAVIHAMLQEPDHPLIFARQLRTGTDEHIRGDELQNPMIESASEESTVWDDKKTGIPGLPNGGLHSVPIVVSCI